mmetsp:Transcript_20754/g.39275  ORF Transcript_20754/g.39275 Transcript_20754/m.39275 type:complete len:539 (-) Transcript_20754:214-1830(-)
MKIPPPPFNTSSVYTSDSGSRSCVGGIHDGENHQDNNNLDAYYGYYGSQNSSSPDTNNEGHSHRAAETAQQLFPQQELSSQKYHDYYGTPQQTYDQQNTTQRVEETYAQSHARRLDQSHEESFNEEELSTALPTTTSTPSSSSSSIKDKILPNVFLLAQKLLPTVMKRLGQHDASNNSFRIEEDCDDNDDDDFPGRCSPLGNPVKSPPTFSEAKRRLNSPFYGNNNLKTTGLEPSDLVDERDEEGHRLALDVVEEGAGYLMGERQRSTSVDDDECDDSSMTEYLPRSAALLVSALQSSARQVKRYPEGSPSLPSSKSVEDFFKSPRTDKRTLEMESRADALLESIRKTPDSASRRLFEGSSQDGKSASRSFNAVAVSGNATATAAFFDDDDDSVAGSIGGDMARLTRSIANIQRDLENVDFSHLDDVYNDGFGGVSSLEEYDGDSGLVARIKLWLSRGTIMEQKLLNTYVNPMENENDNNEEGAARSGSYADNPVLVWSLALMWGFVVLILMHPKIAELVEGRDDVGQMADIVEWLFN